VQSVFDVAGAGTFYGLGYTHFLQRIGGYTHSLTGGVDDKRFVNSVDFQGLPVGVNVRSRPFAIGYNASYEHAAGVTSLYLNYARNIPRGKLNDKIHYAGSRFGAVPIWDAVRFGGTADLRLSGDWLLRWRGDGQITGQPLISGEQFGAGGARSVRGYQEREISGDVGVFSSIEAWSPPLVGDARVIGFFDVAHLRNKKALALGEKNLQDSIASVGLGLRWFWRTNLSVEADVARALSDGAINTPDGTESGDYRVHVNAFYRF
jgi:hemolysin activation/secretion protein